MSPSVFAACALAVSWLPAQEIVVEESAVVAYVAGDKVWERVHADPPTAGPVRLEREIVYAIGPRVFVVDAYSGVTLGRTFLDGSAEEAGPATFRMRLERSGERLLVELPELVAQAGAPRPASFSVAVLGARRDAAAIAERRPALLEEQLRLQPENAWLEVELARRDGFDASCGGLRNPGLAGAERVRLAADLQRECGEAAAEAFDVGLGELRSAGYQPELVRWLVTPLLALGTPDATLPLGELVQRADWTWQLAPRAEGTARMYRGLAEALWDAGRWDEGQKYALRAAEAEPYVMLGADIAAVREVGGMMHVVAGSTAALLLMTLIACFRFLPPAGGGGRRRLRDVVFTAWWPRPLVIGLLATLGLGAWAGNRLADGVEVIGAVAAMPSAVASGDLGHPESQRFWAQATRAEAGRFMYGLSLQMGGELEAAAAMYRTIPGHAGAVQNLRVMESELGARAVSAGTASAVALPDEATWAGAVRATMDPMPVEERLAGLGELVDGVVGGTVLSPGLALSTWLGLLALLGLVGHAGTFRPARESAQPFRALGRGFGSGWAVLLPLALAVTLTGASMLGVYVSTDGLAVEWLSAIATPDYMRYFGVDAAPTPSPAGPAAMTAFGLLAVLVLRLAQDGTARDRVRARWVTPRNSTSNSPMPSWSSPV